MHRFLRSHIRVRQQGQTLIIALIVMGVLLILGLVFLGLINRNIRNAATSQRRSEASDLAEAGIRYAHGQLLTSPLGADWRGAPTIVAATVPGGDLTGDPDAYYLRPGNFANDANQISGVAGDLGGPDKLGPFVRIPFPGGRALVRVRYGATDANPAPAIAGPLRNPGAARATIIIEAVGRPGVINPRDPTTFVAQGGLKFQGFANDAALTAGIAAMAQADGQVRTSRKLTAFAPIGIIDFARFETNVFKSSAPIEMGIPDGLGVSAFDDVAYNDGAGLVGVTDVGSKLAMQLGSPGGLGVISNGRNAGQGFGSLMANGDLRLYGRNNFYLNRTLGDGIRVAGRIMGGVGASMNIVTTQFNPATGYGFYNPITLQPVLTEAASRVTLLDNDTAQSFDSQDPGFNTAGGLVLDGSSRTDKIGFASGVGQLPPPSALTVDPQTKLNRYVAMTRESGGILAGAGNAGQFGHGRGVYVNNAADRQEPIDADGRRIVGSQRSLFDDWLNPSSGTTASGSGWVGPYYIPQAAMVQLLADGWTIQRNGSASTPANEKTWKDPAGLETGRRTIRYRVGVGTDNQVHVLNTFSFADPRAIDGGLARSDYSNGPLFNGVLYFEGNVRVRGTIPTDVQLTLVSGATIYIEGSVLKGTSRNDVTEGTPRGAAIDRLPSASLMLMAKDNVAVNTPNFFGPVASQSLDVAQDVSGATGINPVRLRSGDSAAKLDFVTELPLEPIDPATGFNSVDARQWRPFVMNYRSWAAPTTEVPTNLLVTHTMDDGTASASFIALDVNEGSGASSYAFDADDGLITNAYAAYAGTGSLTTPYYGLGAEPWQRYSRFEARSFPIVPKPAATTYNANNGLISGLGYNLFSGGNNLVLHPGSLAGVSINDTLVGRMALAPNDVKIEASVFAEQGSFFVIPGPWFNPNPNDTHKAFADSINTLKTKGLNDAQARARAVRDRLEAYGAAPYVPFYGEPLDVRVNLVGSVAENLPPPISVQSEWIRKWGWIPRRLGSTGQAIPRQHVPSGLDMTDQNFVPNLVIQYDPILATGRLNDAARPFPIRADGVGRPLPPMPRLPVSPKLAYFGEL